MRRLRRELAEILYQCANVEPDPHMRRTLRRLAARLVPAATGRR